MFVKHILRWLGLAPGLAAAAWHLCPASHREPPADVHVHVIHQDYPEARDLSVSAVAGGGLSRREALRAAVRLETEAAKQLQEAVTHPRVKERAALEAARIAEIETLFLNQRDHRTPTQETRWLDYAEQAFNLWKGGLRQLQVAVRTYGVTIEMIGEAHD